MVNASAKIDFETKLNFYEFVFTDVYIIVYDAI